MKAFSIDFLFYDSKPLEERRKEVAGLIYHLAQLNRYELYEGLAISCSANGRTPQDAFVENMVAHESYDLIDFGIENRMSRSFLAGEMYLKEAIEYEGRHRCGVKFIYSDDDARIMEKKLTMAFRIARRYVHDNLSQEVDVERSLETVSQDW